MGRDEGRQRGGKGGALTSLGLLEDDELGGGYDGGGGAEGEAKRLAGLGSRRGRHLLLLLLLRPRHRLLLVEALELLQLTCTQPSWPLSSSASSWERDWWD